MHPYLTRLGVRPEVQQFFRPFYEADDIGNLLFAYGGDWEHFGFAFHKIPMTDSFWMAGNLQFEQVRLVVLCASALDAVSWLNKKLNIFPQLENMLFLSLGAGINDGKLLFLREHLAGKQYRLLFGNDLLGRMADLKLAAAIRGWPLLLYLAEKQQLIVEFRGRQFTFSQEHFSLFAFEKAARIRFGVATDKPKSLNTFFDELKAGAGLLNY